MTISFIYCAHTIHTSNAHATHNMYTACLYFTPIPIGNIHTCVYIYIHIYIYISTAYVTDTLSVPHIPRT